MILVHGGCWQAPWAFDQLRSLAAALTAEGYATWSITYRRLGDPGGGWPGTLEDVARGADRLREAARRRPWTWAASSPSATRPAASSRSARGPASPAREFPLHSAKALPLRGVVSLAGITDLRAGAEGDVCGDAIPQLLGGPPRDQAGRLAQSSPIELVPLGVPVRLVCGARDPIVPIDQARSYEAAAQKAGDTVAVEIVKGAGHYELVNPSSTAWPAVRDAVRDLLAP